ncbi:hypothetical protein N7490_007230 [Penicillium lividum]|nr:hypothetical protein N7490_007230 [Penicillium lividum]
MAEVTGLVLGGIPLAIWALEKYAEPFEAFHNYHTSIETFRVDLILQNRQFQTTLGNIGLSNEPSIEELRECFETKISSISRELIYIVQRMDSATAKLLKNLDIDVARKRTKVVDDLRHWNDDLRSLEKSELPAEDDSGRLQDLKRRFDIKRCGATRQSLSSLHRALQSGFRCACSPPHQVAIVLDWEAYESKPAKPFKVAVSYGATQHVRLSGSWRRLHVALHVPSQIISPAPLLTPPPSHARAHSPSSFFRSRLHFRFRSVSRTPSPPPPPPPTPPVQLTTLNTVSTATTTQITNLCNTLCTECDSSTLAGFLKDPDEDQDQQFSLNHNQADMSNILKAIPLKSLLSSSEQSTQQQASYTSLSAKQRYAIAASTAWSVLYLSGSSWLSDHWDEKQANLFLEKSQGGREVLSRHLSVACVFSSPKSSEPTRNDFSHLIPNRTVFALGILLIELCINKSFAEFRHIGESASASLLHDYQAALRKLDEFYRLAGDSYGYAAECCVTFAFQGRDLYKDFEFFQFRQQFYDTVVAPVQATYLAFSA